MCRYIDAACLVANVVSERPKRKSFSLQELGRVYQRVEDALKDENAAIEWTRGSFLAAMFYYSDLFTKRDETLSVTPRARDLLTKNYVASEFNHALPAQVQAKMRAAIREACPA